MSNGPEFFQTQMGRRFYEGDVPRIARALEKIADNMENNKISIPKWENVITSMRLHVNSSHNYSRFTVTDNDTILCESNADADCIAEFLESCGMSGRVCTRPANTGQNEWEVYIDVSV